MGLVEFLRRERPGWEIVGQAADGLEAERLVMAHHPNVLLLDLDLPLQDGLATLRHLAHNVPNLRIIVLTMHSGPAVVHRMRMAGADGFVVKSEATRVIVQAIQQVLQNRSYFHAGACFNSQQEPLSLRYVLTDRELDVMRLLAKDLVNKEIAGLLDISVRTVESHRASIFEKMHVRSLSELIGIAVREQVV